MSRLPGWEQPWQDFIMRAREEEFVWGTADCITLAGQNILVLTGRDYISEHIDKYSSEIGAFRYLKQLGCDRPEDMIDTLLSPIPVSFAQTGDLVLYQDSLGIVITSHAVFRGEEKTELVPTLDCTKAWKVE